MAAKAESQLRCTMGFTKTHDERLDGVLEYIDKYFAGSKPLFEQRIAGLGAQKSTISNGLSLGARDQDKSAAETERRNGVRTLLFLAFTEGKQPIALAESFKAKYLAMSQDQIKSEIKGRLPVLDSSPLRAFWSPMNFTQVQQTPQLQTAPSQFRYIVCAMMNKYTARGVSYETIVKSPDILKTFMLSGSIIDESHRPTYYPYGFILSVPQENIVSTSRKDQSFKNYKAEDPLTPLTPAVKNDQMDEVRRVAGGFSIQPPAAILQETKARGSSGYNEIVVLGTGPTGTQIRPIGIFMKVDTTGNRYARPNDSLMGWKNETAFVTDDILAKIKLTGLPIVQIIDDSGSGK
jgi:hypothetical protein